MSDRGGWIVLHRKLLDKPIWFESTAEQKVILITLLLMAKYGQKVPKRCEKCEYCRRTRQLSGFVEVADLID